jgi:hypothetical protein
MGARRFVSLVLVSSCVLVGMLACGVGGAEAIVGQFGSQGEGAGKFEGPRGVAVDQASGDVYLMDFGNVRIDKFSSEGVFQLAWGWGVADATQGLQTCTATCYHGSSPDYGPGTGEFGLGVGGVAVDNDPLSPSYEDVYVSDNGNSRVEKFSPSGGFLGMFGKEVNEDGSDVCVAGEKCQPGRTGEGSGEFSGMRGAIAVSPTGDVYVGDFERVQEFGPEGLFIAQFAVGGGVTRSVAVDGAGDLYVVSGSPGEGEEPAGLREYDSSGALLRTLDGEGEPRAVTLDASGDLFLDDSLGGHRLLEYAPSGEQLASFDTGTQELDAGGGGIAFGDTIARLYVPNQSAVRLVSVPPPGPELIGSESASGIEPLSATLNATINPEGNATTYRFEYGPTTSYGSSAPAPEGSLSANFNEEPVSIELTKLTAGTTYHYRIEASDSKGHVTTGQDQTFTTQPAVLIDSLSVSNVAETSATLEALLNPLGAAASYRLEYDTSEYTPGGPSHGITAIEGSLGAGTSDVPISMHVDGLQLGTLYHYRVVAHDTRESVEYTVDGPDQTFTTQGQNGGPTLPDGRQWEMVSPPEKNGAQIFAIGQYSGEGAVIEAAAGGGAVTYMTAAPTEPSPQGYANYLQVFSARGSSGWVSRDISPPHDTAAGLTVGYGEEFRFFSEDLSLGLIQPFGAFTRSLSDEASEQTPFVHTDFLNGDATDPCVDSCYRPVVSGVPGHADVPPGTEFGNDTECNGGLKVICGPRFVGATPDLSHVVLESVVALTSTPVPGAGLYEWSEGSLKLVSLLPDGKAASDPSLGHPTFDNPGDGSRHAISDDGSRLVWAAENHLYLSDMSLSKTARLDVVQGGSGEGKLSPEFQIASADGSRVFFTDEQRLTADSGGTDGKPDFYECEMIETAGTLECSLSDLTPVTGGESTNVTGVVGASEDGLWVYYVVGTTLYVRHAGLTKSVAVLSSADAQDWRPTLSERTSRVSSDGRWVAFMSRGELAGYDTRDAVSGQSDEEVYLYDAQADGGKGRLTCASCDPTGARPVGIEYQKIGDGIAGGDRIWESERWIAANVPGWTPYWLVGSLYQSRYLSDSGRLFFNSNDGLVPRDVNGTEDVYEFEPPGVGDCTTASVSFSAGSGGCVDLISSGGSGEESGFMDATATGSEVFFLTAAKLSSEDRDSAIDLYDARECTAGSPCFAQAPVVPPACDTGDSCKAAPSPQPAVFGAPASATFTGAGNVTTGDFRAGVKTRGLTRAHKLARALRACGKEKRRRRAVCRRRARAKYAVKRSLRVGATGKGGR